MDFKGKNVLVTGGTGSLGKVLTRRLLGGEMGMPHQVTIFSRDEAKQYEMRMTWKHLAQATDDIAYKCADDVLKFHIGDVRDFASLRNALRDIDVVFNTAALKQVPACEYFPFEAVRTNIMGPQNLIRAIQEMSKPPQLVVGISTDKACKPVNVMGMTKSLQERIFIQGNLVIPETKFICVRYGNVLASRGSVIPLFKEQIRKGGPITITTSDMTRFLLSLDKAVDTIFAGVREGQRGETYIPRVPSANVVDIATLLMGEKKIPIQYTGIRPGEKIHEILISEEECHRTIERNQYYAIQSILPEIADGQKKRLPSIQEEFSSRDHTLNIQDLKALLEKEGFLDDLADVGSDHNAGDEKVFNCLGGI